MQENSSMQGVFLRILEINDNDNQDIRLPALMGKECNIADEPSDDDELNRRICDESEELYGLIADDRTQPATGYGRTLWCVFHTQKSEWGVCNSCQSIARPKMLQKHGWM